MANRTIYKYELVVTDAQTLYLPEGAAVLSVANQQDTLVLYAHVDPSAPCRLVAKVLIFGTGNPVLLPTGARFLGTVAQYDGRLMWHVFVLEGGSAT